MKKLMYLLLTTIMITSLNANALDLSEKDKELHFTGSVVQGALTYSVLRLNGYNEFQSYVGSVGLNLLIGYAKESSDEKFSKQDMKANFMGANTGVVPLMIVGF